MVDFLPGVRVVAVVQLALVQELESLYLFLHFRVHLVHYDLVVALRVRLLPQLLGEDVAVLLVVFGDDPLLRVETRVLLYFRPLLEFFPCGVVYLHLVPTEQLHFPLEHALHHPQQLVVKQVMRQFMCHQQRHGFFRGSGQIQYRGGDEEPGV